MIFNYYNTNKGVLQVVCYGLKEPTMFFVRNIRLAIKEPILIRIAISNFPIDYLQ